MESAQLEEFNHWWIEGKVDLELALPFKRDVYFEIEKKFSNRFILAITGLRRIGKTTIMYQLIQELLNNNIPKTNILFFSFDEVNVKLGELFDKYKEIHNNDLRKEKVYVFLDEIQKCAGWENELKKYYDLYPKIKFIISGSESLFIRKKTKERLAGRILDYTLSTFSFKEFLRFNNIDENEYKYESKIRPLFNNFILKGGFVETFNFKSDKDFKDYIRSIVIDKIVYKDIPRMFRLEDVDFLRVLLELIASNPGMFIDYLSLSRQFGKDRRVIKDYINYLKESFLISLLGNYRRGNLTTLRKMKRAYPTDNALIYLYKLKIEDDFIGRMVETIAVNNLKASTFWKNGGEIDIIYNDHPIEVKYQEVISSNDFKTIREFMRKFNKKEGIILTKKEEKVIKFEEGEIRLIPIWKWLLE